MLGSISLFDKIYKKILIEENLQDNTIKLYNDLEIAIIPGTFSPPNKNDWDIILQYCKLVKDKVILIISNINKDNISKRVLSKSNLDKFFNIITQIEQATNIKNIKDELENKIQKFTYLELTKYCSDILLPQLDNQELKEKLLSYLDSLKNKLFENIKYTENGVEITADKIEEILNIYANDYNVIDKIQIKISEQITPVNDMINLIKNDCSNCTIYIGSIKYDKQLDKFDSLILDLNKYIADNNLNNFLVYKTFENKINISDKYVRNNILTLKKEWLPEKISETDFDKIKEILIK